MMKAINTLKVKMFVAASVLAVVLFSATAIAVPHNTDLLDCGNIPADGACNAALQTLCDATNETQFGDEKTGFKKQNDHDSLVSKVVGAALKYYQGKGDKGDLKLEDYGSKLNSMNCYNDDSKPKIQCALQVTLNDALIAAQGECS